MELTIVVLLVVLVVLWIWVRIQGAHTPTCSPLPPPVVIDTLGTSEKTPLGIETGILRALYSVVEPPSCVSDPQRAHSEAVADPGDVRRILQFVARVASDKSEYSFFPGTVVHSAVMVDRTGEGEFYITAMMHERSTSTTLRFSVRARMQVQGESEPLVLHMNFDPQTSERMTTEPCRSGVVPVPEYGHAKK